jgi:hypothetical protein
MSKLGGSLERISPAISLSISSLLNPPPPDLVGPYSERATSSMTFVIPIDEVISPFSCRPKISVRSLSGIYS